MGSMVLIVDDEYIGRETLQSVLEGKATNLKWRRTAFRPSKRQNNFCRM